MQYLTQYLNKLFDIRHERMCRKAHENLIKSYSHYTL